MITDYTAQSLTSAATTTSTAAPETWQAPAAARRLTTLVRMVSSKLASWVKTPALPYAALWEASLVVDALQDRESYEPDPFVTELPHTRLDWPRG